MDIKSPVTLGIKAPPKEGEGASVTFQTNDKEILRISDNGFYVRGVKLAIDDNEAASVYKAFREFLIWSALVRG